MAWSSGPRRRGRRKGPVISPLLANVYLHPVDQALGAAGYQVVRYADDLVILCASAEEAQRALSLLRTLLEQCGLRLHPEKTRVVDATQPGGFDFLGYHFEQGTRWPRKKSMQKLKDTVRRQTRRTRGREPGDIVAGLNPVLRGWFGYFTHSHPATFRRCRRRGSGCDCAVSCVNATATGAAVVVQIISDGRTRTSTRWVSSRSTRPGTACSGPHRAPPTGEPDAGDPQSGSAGGGAALRSPYPDRGL